VSVVRGCHLDWQTGQRTTRSLVRQLVLSGTRPETLPAHLLRIFATHIHGLKLGRRDGQRGRDACPQLYGPARRRASRCPQRVVIRRRRDCCDTWATPSGFEGPSLGQRTGHLSGVTCSITSESRGDVTCDSLGDVTWSHGTHDVKRSVGKVQRFWMRKQHQDGQNRIVMSTRGFLLLWFRINRNRSSD